MQLRSGVEEFVKDETRKKHPCFLAVPQCPPDKQWTNVGWFDGKPQRAARQKPHRDIVLLVLDLIDTVRQQRAPHRQGSHLPDGPVDGGLRHLGSRFRAGRNCSSRPFQ